MNHSAQKIIKPIIAILWLIVDFLLYTAGLFDELGNFKAIFAIILWVVILWAILKVFNLIFQD
ncbi:MAG: hypothetical protein JNJ43_10140 [Anaerolineales bacterium]|nr:hypothetical protein [Anaerolineales bacterium]